MPQFAMQCLQLYSLCDSSDDGCLILFHQLTSFSTLFALPHSLLQQNNERKTNANDLFRCSRMVVAGQISFVKINWSRLIQFILFMSVGESRFVEVADWSGATPRCNKHKSCEP